MSDLSSFDLEKLFLPDWAVKPASANRFAGHSGEDRRSERDDRGPRPPRRDGPRPPGQGQRPGGFRPPGGSDRRGPDRGGRFDSQRGPRRDEPRQAPREERPPMPELAVAILPDEKSVESLARQIRLAGRAFPLFEIARMVLLKPDRYVVRFSVLKNKEGAPATPLLLCALDDSLWFSENEAVAHVLDKHFATFYQAERIQTEPPKGVYTFVAQCGLSGVILGPPNHHDYQNQLRRLHAERFERMPFDAFKARVKIVRDEAVVKKWIEDLSFKTEFVVLNVPEPLRLATREEVEAHFRAVHLANIVKPIESHTLTGLAALGQPNRAVGRLTRWFVEDQRQFPMQIATALSQAFAQRGLQFFKVNKTITHVCVARPHHLDIETTTVADGIRRIVEFINSKPGCTRKKLVAALVAVPFKPAAPLPVPAPVQAPPAPVEGGNAEARTDGEPAAAAPPAPAAPRTDEPTPELTALNADLHWLIHQGHVIEFHTGILETAKKPVIKPPKPAPAPMAKPEPAPTTVAEPPPAVAEAAVVPAVEIVAEPTPVANEAPTA